MVLDKASRVGFVEFHNNVCGSRKLVHLCLRHENEKTFYEHVVMCTTAPVQETVTTLRYASESDASPGSKCGMTTPRYHEHPTVIQTSHLTSV